ncbi:cytochrome B [Veronia nyctiphanis]|uniref:Cytochrome B n=1 Tax=Veronia nyctiphanis TaxID=1278244 RepID=A0A4Q0YPX6_9GAMM|nr:COX15/CtaA family protein [Veronia nyctiphanis]RXJ73042.1 cytochrome B [Veronia nyctiphanis]
MDKDRTYRIFIYVTLVWSLMVVAMGAYTRLTEAGLGCPDWPGCYGLLTVPQTEIQITKAEKAFPGAPVEIEKAWNEMIHRYIAGGLGLMIAAIACMSWQVKGRPRIVPAALLGVVVFQAVLGMWTVTMNLMPIVVMGHLMGGFCTVTLLGVLARRQYLERQRQKKSEGIHHRRLKLSPIDGKTKALAVGAFFAVVLQIVLGGWTSANYAATVCTQLPICEVDWVEKYDTSAFNLVVPEHDTYQYGVLNFDQRVTIHATHRIGAIIVSGLVLLLAAAVYRLLGARQSYLLVGLLSVQIILGVTNVVALLPLPVAVAHNLGGLALLLAVVNINMQLFYWTGSLSVLAKRRDARGLSHG